MKAVFRNAETETGPAFASTKAERVGPNMQRRRVKMIDLEHCGDAVRRTCILSFAALVLIAGFSLVGVLNHAQAATEAECRSEFEDSEAAGTCTIDSASASGNYCTITGTCQHNSLSFSSTITAELDDISDMVNCSGNLATFC